MSVSRQLPRVSSEAAVRQAGRGFYDRRDDHVLVRSGELSVQDTKAFVIVLQ